VTAVSALLASGVGLTAGRVVVLGLAVLTGQLSIGWSNDRIDVHRDAATARTDKPAATGGVPPHVVAFAAAAALVVTLALSFALGPFAAAALLTLVASGWAYNLGLKATLLSGVAYAIGFAALPMAPYLALPGHPWPPWWVPVTGALLGLGAHFANVLPDLRRDAATGVRGLPQRLGARGSTIVMAATLAAASVVLGFGPTRPFALALGASLVGLVGALLVATLAYRAPESPAAFRVTIVLALLDVTLIVVLTN
jgi:4-hydroxybenzoate polyprenyltransferase